MNKSEKVLILTTIILVGFAISVFFHYILGFYVGLGHFFNTFLSVPETFYSDFSGPLAHLKNLQPYAPPANWQNYFPLSFVFIYPLVFIKNTFFAYLIMLSAFLASLLWANIKYLSCADLNKIQNFKNIFVITFLSYPFLYLVDRGNLDMLIFIFLAAFACLFNAEKYKLSALCLAVANAMKPFPFLFLILFLVKKKYKEFFLSLVLTILFIIGGFMFFKGSVLSQFNVLIQSWKGMTNGYVFLNDNSCGMVNGSSLFMLLKLICCQITKTPIISTHLLLKIYNIFSFFALIFMVYFISKEKSYWKKLSLLSLYMVLIPTFIYDYKLMFLFIPLWFFVNAEEKSKYDLIYVVLFGLLLLPKYFVIPTFLWGIEGLGFSISLILNPVIMILFTGLIIFEQLKNKNGVKN